MINHLYFYVILIYDVKRGKGMKEIKFEKLVRNRIVESIKNQGDEPVYRVLDDNEYEMLLERKLDEEVSEYHQDKTLEELADIMEVVVSLCAAKGYTTKDLIEIYQKKHEEKGGFSDKIYLISKITK